MAASLWFIRVVSRPFARKFSHKLDVRALLDREVLGGFLGELLPHGVLLIPVELVGDIAQFILGDFEKAGIILKNNLFLYARREK